MVQGNLYYQLEHKSLYKLFCTQICYMYNCRSFFSTPLVFWAFWGCKDVLSYIYHMLALQKVCWWVVIRSLFRIALLHFFTSYLNFFLLHLRLIHTKKDIQGVKKGMNWCMIFIAYYFFTFSFYWVKRQKCSFLINHRM